MRCPRCGLINPVSAQTCDCGYDFRSGTSPAKRDDEHAHQTESARRKVILGVFLSAIVLVLVLGVVFAKPGAKGLLILLLIPVAVGLRIARIMRHDRDR